MKTKKAKKIEALLKAECQYPIHNDEGTVKQCGKKQLMNVALPLLSLTESGKVEAHQNEGGGVTIPIPFCSYHAFIMMCGQFGVMTKNNKPQYLHGPFDTVNLIETVVEAKLHKDKWEVKANGRDKNNSERRV